jgi:hypothetical protein
LTKLLIFLAITLVVCGPALFFVVVSLMKEWMVSGSNQTKDVNVVRLRFVRRSLKEESQLTGSARNQHSPDPASGRPGRGHALEGRAAYLRESRSPAREGSGEPRHPSQQAPIKSAQAVAPAPQTRWAEDGVDTHQLADPVVIGADTDLVPSHAVPPVFTPSRASRLPWLLPDEPAAPPGVAADQAQVGNLIVRAASVVGAGHRCEKPAKPRQDAYRVAQDAAGAYLVVAVADGMSDSARAELGASVAVGTAVAILRRRLDQGAGPADMRAVELFREIAQNIIGAAHDRGLDVADVRTTLAVAVLPTSTGVDGAAEAWCGQIADTHLWMRENTGWRCLTGESKESFDGNALRKFLPHHPDGARDQHFVVFDGQVTAMLTDGVADAFAEVPGADTWLAERWKEPTPLASFMLDVDFEAKSMQDDRTAVVVWSGFADTMGRRR